MFLLLLRWTSQDAHTRRYQSARLCFQHRTQSSCWQPRYLPVTLQLLPRGIFSQNSVRAHLHTVLLSESLLQPCFIRWSDVLGGKVTWWEDNYYIAMRTSPQIICRLVLGSHLGSETRYCLPYFVIYFIPATQMHSQCLKFCRDDFRSYRCQIIFLESPNSMRP